MPRWNPVTVSDLQDAKVAKLVTALRTKALADGQTDPVERVIASVVTDIRRKVASCRANRTDADATTIPASLLPLACDLIIFRLKLRLEIPLTDDERTNQSTHERTLNRIASCDDVIEQPDDAAAPAVEVTSGTPHISNCRAEARRRRRSGL
jgi:hypothetical protein